ncbi:MAG: ribosomal protein [Firmicutes bacterium]|nr:ribosomal protein [Bacillota bacterium]
MQGVSPLHFLHHKKKLFIHKNIAYPDACAIDMLPKIVLIYTSDIFETTVVSEVYIVRNAVTFACSECKQRNYQSNKNKKNDPDRLELNKYCKFCKKHTQHKETK